MAELVCVQTALDSLLAGFCVHMLQQPGMPMKNLSNTLGDNFQGLYLSSHMD